jgi:WD repeat-containing protein 17
MMKVFTSAGNKGIIYSISWSSADARCIAASTARDGVFVLDIDKGKVIQRFMEVGVICC